MTLEWGFFSLITLIDFMTAIIIFFSALNERMLLFPVWYRIGLVAAAFGFAAQGGLNMPYLLYGKKLLANTLPFWVLKDLGISIIASHYFFTMMIAKRPKPKPRTRTMKKRITKPVVNTDSKSKVKRSPTKK